MTIRRRVRVADSFFDQLDEALGAERSTDGAPSRLDFLLIELPAVIEEFASGWDRLLWMDPMFDDERVLIRRGLIVSSSRCRELCGLTAQSSSSVLFSSKSAVGSGQYLWR